RLRGEADGHRPRRHRVGLRRRRRRGGVEQRGRDVQRDARARAARLHRGTDRQDLERQSAPRVERGGESGAAVKREATTEHTETTERNFLSVTTGGDNGTARRGCSVTAKRCSVCSVISVVAFRRAVVT